MTLVISKGITLRKGWQPMDPDAAAYITAVETADTEPLEEKTKIAIDNFVLGCKQDGIWDAIKASCILAGARTLTGALVPLVGAAPTNSNFVDVDYNRKTGLVGNGSNKALDSNRPGNADPQNSFHMATYVTVQDTRTTSFQSFIGNGIAATEGSSHIFRDFTLNVLSCRIRQSSSVTSGFTSSTTGLIGASRSGASTGSFRAGGSSIAISTASQTPVSETLRIYRRGDGSPLFTNARLSFYSIGESLDLALLDARVTDLINAFGAAIP
jgi:hypothetical protein